MRGAINRCAKVRHWLAALSLFFIAQWSAAASDEDLGLKEAISRTLAHNPVLVAFGYQVQARQGRVTQSQIKPGPKLGLEVENVLGTGGRSGIKGTETTLSLGWVLERGKRRHYMEAARSGVSALEAQVEIGRLDAVASTARLFLDNLEFQERYKISQEAIGMAEQTVATVKRRVESGRAPAADRVRAEAELAKVRLVAADMEHDLSNARHRLATQWAQVHPDFRQVTGNWRQLPTPDSVAALLELVDGAPDVSTYMSQQRLREAELRLAEIQSRPDWLVSAGIRRLEQADDYAFSVGITIPLKAKDRNRGRVAEAQANLAMVDAQRAATRLQVEAQLFAIHHELQHSLYRAKTLRDELLPRLQEAAAQTRQGYEAGRYSYFELQQLESELLLTRTGLVEASIDARRLLIEIERLTGAVMPSAVQ